MKRNRLLLLSVLVLSGCNATTTNTPSIISPTASSESPTQIETIFPTRTTTLRPTKTATLLPTASVSPTNTPVVSLFATLFHSLNNGQYIAYEDPARGNGLYLVSMDGDDFGTLFEPTYYSLSLTPDGHKIEILPGNPIPIQVLDLDTNELTPLPDIDRECDFSIVSPDMSAMAYLCHREKDIFVMSLKDMKPIQVTTDTAEARHYSFPLWSPDGKWLAYFKDDIGIYANHPAKPETGLYLVNASCLNDPPTCVDKKIGPYYNKNLWLQFGFFAWSPDSQYIVDMSNSKSLVFFNVNQKTFFTRSLPEFPKTSPIAWSPDNKYIAYTVRDPNGSGSALYILPVIGGSPKLVLKSNDPDMNVAFWISIHP